MAEEEEVEIKDMVILFITTPKELNGRKQELSTLGQGSEVEVADVIHGRPPDFLCFGKPVRRIPSSAEASNLRVI